MKLAEEIVNSLMSTADGEKGDRLAIMSNTSKGERSIGGWSKSCAIREIDAIIAERLKSDLIMSMRLAKAAGLSVPDIRDIT